MNEGGKIGTAVRNHSGKIFLLHATANGDILFQTEMTPNEAIVVAEFLLKNVRAALENRIVVPNIGVVKIQ